ncbi:MAG TPA: chorismate synthase [Candidatus Ozemobacteraceae bacterium]|nr:chorismate synthase [Candidatus Ozemobacteraceae bacterium]
MGRLRQLTAGESHGEALIGILDGLVRGIPVSDAAIASQLKRRRVGYGRSTRQSQESDRFRIIGGVRQGMSTGNPFGILLENDSSSPAPETLKSTSRKQSKSALTKDMCCPRSGHADFVGMLRWGETEAVDVAERASARETAVLVALAVPARELLAQLGVLLGGMVTRMGSIEAQIDATASVSDLLRRTAKTGDVWMTPDSVVVPRWREVVDEARHDGDTLGGAIRVLVDGLIPGLGGFSQRWQRIDGRLSAGLMALPGVKAVSIGRALETSRSRGSACCDEMRYSDSTGVRRLTNWAGGLEGGMTNGEPLVIELLMKPIPTGKGRMSVNVKTLRRSAAACPRHDTIALAALAVIAESVVAIELADAYLELLGGTTLEDVKAARKRYLARLRPLWLPKRSSRRS